MRDKHALATEAIYIEQELLKEAVGAQDQVSAAYGGFNRINFQTDGTIEVRRVLTAPTRLAELEQHLAEMLGVKVDLVSRKALKGRIGRRIENEIIPV